MANKLYNELLTNIRPSNRKYLDADLSEYVLIEIGSIENIYDNNRCTVRTSRIVNRSAVYYKDVEVLYAGATVVPTGTPCLLFRPLTSVPNTRDGRVDIDVGPYDRTGMKAVPLFQGTTGVDSGYTGSGDYVIKHGAEWQVRFEPEAISIWAGKAPVATLHTADNSLDTDLAGGRFHSYWHDGATKTVHFDTDGKIIAYDEVAADDTRTMCRGAKEDDIKLDDIPNRDNWNVVVTVSPEGNVSFLAGEDDKLTFQYDYEAGNVDVTFGENGELHLAGDDDEVHVKNEKCSVDLTASKVDIAADGCTFSMDGQGKAITFTDGTNKYETSASGTVINGHLTVMP